MTETIEKPIYPTIWKRSPDAIANRFHMDGYYRSVAGGRTVNEDCVSAKEGYPFTEKGIDAVYFLADGLGGHQDGKIASWGAVSAISSYNALPPFPDGKRNLNQMNKKELFKKRISPALY